MNSLAKAGLLLLPVVRFAGACRRDKHRHNAGYFSRRCQRCVHIDKNVLRIIRTGGNLPEDRESLYWLDIKSIPSSNPDNKHNTLMLAVKSGI